MQRIAAVTLLIGSVIAFFGESRPIIFEVYGGAPNPQQIIDADPSAWATAMALMVLGTIIVAVGILLLSRHVQHINDDQTVKRLSTIAAVSALLSALSYAVLRYYLVVLPWDASGPLEPVLSVAFMVLWQVALILTGYALLRSGYPKWLGWPVIAVAGLLLVASLITGGMPPAIYFFVIVFMGIALLFVREPQSTSSPTTQLKGAGAS